MTVRITEEQEKALTKRFIHLVQTKNTPLAEELKNTLTIMGIYIDAIHGATTADLFQYRQRAIRG